jgi:enoyl-CoA hydratase/carnithine racemase
MSIARLGHNERGSLVPDVLTQFTVTDAAPGYWRVIFRNPPVNLEDPDTILELQGLVGRMEADDALRVVVLESADPDFFINHYDVSRAAEHPSIRAPRACPPGSTQLPGWHRHPS